MVRRNTSTVTLPGVPNQLRQGKFRSAQSIHRGCWIASLNAVYAGQGMDFPARSRLRNSDNNERGVVVSQTIQPGVGPRPRQLGGGPRQNSDPPSLSQGFLLAAHSSSIQVQHGPRMLSHEYIGRLTLPADRGAPVPESPVVLPRLLQGKSGLLLRPLQRHSNRERTWPFHRTGLRTGNCPPTAVASQQSLAAWSRSDSMVSPNRVARALARVLASPGQGMMFQVHGLAPVPLKWRKPACQGAEWVEPG